MATTNPTQQVYTSEAIFSVSQEGVIALPLFYNTSDSERLSGITLNLHYNSSLLTPSGANSGFTRQVTAAVVGASIVDDTKNLDGDAQTDKIVQLLWGTFDSSFPSTGTLPAALGTETFKTTSVFGNSIGNSSTKIRFSAQETASGYDFLPSFTTITGTVVEVNGAPTAVALNNTTASLFENTNTSSRIKVADIAISDDAIGTNTISLLSADAASFEVDGNSLYLKAGVALNYETKSAYGVTISVRDTSVSGSTAVSTAYSLAVSDVNEAPTAIALNITRASLAENTNTSSRIKVADIGISDDALGSNTI